MKILGVYNAAEIEIICSGKIILENFTKEYMKIDIKEFKFKNKEVDIEKFIDSYIDMKTEDKAIISIYNKEKDIYINIDVSDNIEVIRNENSKVIAEIQKKFDDTYNQVLKENGLLKIEFDKLNGFSIKNISPFNTNFIKLEQSMNEKKDMIFSKFKNLENTNELIEINEILNII